MSDHFQRWAVITGASSGLGAIFAERLAGQGYALLLTGRDQQRLDEVADRARRIRPDVVTETVPADLGDPSGLEKLLKALGSRRVELLVNNAGFGTYGPLAELDADRQIELLNVNVIALQRITQAVLPAMVARGSGQILNVASTIAFQPAPFQAPYGASKAFVLSFSQALWGETRGTGVTVTALCPGPTRTGFFDALDADVSGIALFEHLAEPGPVVDAGLAGLAKGRPVVVPGIRNRLLSQSSRFAPASLVTRISAKMLRPQPDRVASGSTAGAGSAAGSAAAPAASAAAASSAAAAEEPELVANR